jgi:hypothetical protein
MKTPIVKLKQLAAIAGIAVSGIGVGGAIAPANAVIFGPSNGLKFDFISSDTAVQDAIDSAPTATAQNIAAVNGFKSAAGLWSSYFTDDVTIQIDIGFSTLGSSTLAQASSYLYTYDYANIRNALNNNKTSADDNISVGSLTTSSTFNRLINYTSENSGNTVDVVSTTVGNNISFTSANAKALGLLNSGLDAEITFSSDFAWDFDRSDGIDLTKHDFVGVAAHEIGHALGFYSDVDELDTSGGTKSKNTFTTSILDLFRYSAASKAESAIDFTTGTGDKYFSLDGGVTNIASFSTGETLGDGRQASHWKDSPFNVTSIGIMDPTFAKGEYGVITQNDLRAFDVIGWDRSATSYATSVPEPSNVIGTLMVAAFGAKVVLKRRKKLLEPTAKQAGEEA